MKSALTGFLIFLILAAILLAAAAQVLPESELRRRAKSGKDPGASAVYKMAAYGKSLKMLLAIIGTAGLAGLIFGFVKSSWGVALLLLVIFSWSVFVGHLLYRGRGLAWKIAAGAAPAVSWLLEYLHPVLDWLPIKSAPSHSKLYEREDLLELLQRQGGQIDNRISQTELKAARGALTFGGKTVGSVMAPRKDVVWVSRGEQIGPKLMDDLHKTGFIRFPVVAGDSKPANPEVVGTLYLADLLKNLEKPGNVGDIMKRDAHFINESHTLEQALDGFLKSGQHLLVVVNNFEEVVGVLTLEDVLSQILGQKITDEFDRYHDKHAVAGHDSQKDHSQHSQSKLE